MNETRFGPKDALLQQMETAMLQGVDLYIPSLGDEARKYVPVLRKGVKFLVTLLRNHSHKEAEKLLDTLVAQPPTKL